MTKFEQLQNKALDNKKFKNNKAMFLSSYRKYISKLEDDILNKEIEIEGFFALDFKEICNTTRGYASLYYFGHLECPFEKYLKINRELKKLKDELVEASALYSDLFTPLQDEDNSSK